MTRKASQDIGRNLNVSIWECLSHEEQKAIRRRWTRFKPPPERLSPMETGEDEIAPIMAGNKDVSR